MSKHHPPIDNGLPRLTTDQAKEAGLLTARQIARRFHVDERQVETRLAKRGAPAAVAVTEKPNRTRREKLYSLVDFERYVDSMDGETAIGGRRRSRTPRRVGTGSATGPTPYVWRSRG